MKKVNCLAAVILMAALIFCGCSGNQKDSAKKGTESEQQTTNQSENKNDEVDLSAYKKPADAVSIDLTKDDPSNDEIRFVFDNEGKVTQCYYKIGDQQIYVNYTYNDGSVQIYAFMGDILVADETIELSAYDAEKGFTVIEGYYFKGFSVK